MESKKYLEDISEIKSIMNRSSRFISLSGLSGVLAGIYSLVGAWIARQKLILIGSINEREPLQNSYFPTEAELIKDLYIIAGTVIILAILTGIFLTFRKAAKSGERIWDVSSKRLVLNFLIPLATGGAFSLALLQYGLYGLVAPATLIFYGLACVNASKYTLGDVRYLGIANIIIGLIATQFIGYGLYFWALGFGVFHIFYGALMWYKYDR